MDFKLDAWEDDLPTDGLAGFCTNGTSCTWQDIQCCGVYFFGVCVGIETGDDYRCEAEPFYQGLNYRNGPPCQWYSHGYLNGTCNNSSVNGYYKPHIETYWRYTRGNSFANAIDLGTLNLGVPLTHFNSNECYSDYYPNSSGNDVIYSFNISNPTGVNISLCGVNGAQYDSYLYLVKDTNSVSIAENDNYCLNQSELVTALCDTGTYYIVVDAVSSSELGTFTLLVKEDPSSSFSSLDISHDVSCFGDNDGKINSIISGGFPPYTFNWFDDLMNPISSTVLTMNIEDSVDNLYAGHYIIEIIDNNNCILTDTIIVSEPSQISMITSSVSTSCYGYSDGQLNVQVTGGTAPYSYSWNTNPIQNNANAVFIPSGTYILTLTDENNCVDTISAIVNDPPPVPVSITSPSTNVCIGGSVNLQAMGALSYSWSPNLWLSSNNSQNVIATPNSSINYVVTGTDINGCFNTDTISINVIQSLMMTSTPASASICEGENISIIINGASSYSWFPPNGINNPNASNIIASPQNSTNYMVIGTDNFGCSDTVFVNIDVLEKPSLSITNNPSICEGESVLLSVMGGNNYNWFPSNGLNNTIGSTVTANPLMSTAYYAIGSGSNGCSDTISTVVSVNPVPILNTFPSNTDICMGDTISLFVEGALSYIWNPSIGLNSVNTDAVQASPLSNIVYSVLGIDSLGCTSSSSISVNVNNLPNIDVTSVDSKICLGESTFLTATGGVQYNWDPSNSLSSNTGNVVSASPINNTSYIVTGIDINSCSSWDTISIIVNPLPILSINSLNSTICEGESTPLIVTGATTYVWSPSLGLNTSIGNSVIANPFNSTNYLITGTDLNGCSDIISSNVIVNPSPNLILNPASSSICLGASLQIEAFGANTYSWSPSIGLNTTTSNIVQASPNSSVTYTVTGTDINNCVDSIEFELIVGIPPIVTIDPLNPIICQGESVTLSASGADNYMWHPSTNLSSSIGSSVVANPSQTQVYDVIGTDALDCKDTVSVLVNVIPLPTANIISSSGEICSGDSAAIILDVSGNPDWNINYAVDGSVSQIIASTNPVIIYSSQEGIYTIPFVSDANGCNNVGMGSVYIDVINTPQADFDFTPKNPNMLEPEVSFINNTVFSNSYLWDFGDNSPNSIEYEPTHIYEEDGTYYVALIAENESCRDTAMVNLVINPYFALYIPNVFTPNQDGLNDNFEPKGVGIEEYEIFIFNRWGEQVFTSDDILNSWDGGEAVSGMYTYIINVVDKIGEFHRKTGFVLIE